MSDHPASDAGWATERPVIVTGMHRSGTSLVAALVANAGVVLRNDHVGPNRSNPRGYFEDAEFLALDREMLQLATRGGVDGHPDWGWTETEELDLSVIEPFRDRARALVEKRIRAAGGKRWGWKDPRTALLLPFWESVFANACYVFVYRPPWEVADSMQRLGADVFLGRPDYARRIWSFYNRRLVEFHSLYRERTILVCAETVRRFPERFNELLSSRFGLPGNNDPAAATALIDPELFRTHGKDDSLGELAGAMDREAARLLTRLDEAADLPPEQPLAARPPLEKDGRFSSATGDAPRLSVIIPCYNQGEYLAEAIASAARSIDEPCELIIVNDGSNDPATLEVLATLRSIGYLVVDQENRGLSAARNRGIELARGEYILPLDADNRLRPGFVPAALELLERQPEVGVVYGDRQDFGLRNQWVDVPQFDPDLLLVSNYIDACAVLRRAVWREVGGYDPEISAWSDWDLWLTAMERGWKFAHLGITAFDYRVRPDSMLSKDTKPEVRARWCAHLTQKHRELYQRRLDSVLLAAQRLSGDLFFLGRKHERLNADFEEERARLQEEIRRAKERPRASKRSRKPSALEAR